MCQSFVILFHAPAGSKNPHTVSRASRPRVCGGVSPPQEQPDAGGTPAEREGETHATRAHLDLLMELQPGGPLASWRLLATPEELDPVDAPPLSAEQQPDHRREYLTYEGPVSGDRGHVHRVDTGTLIVLARSPRHVRFTLAGLRMRGTFALRHVEGNRWELRHENGGP